MKPSLKEMVEMFKIIRKIKPPLTDKQRPLFETFYTNLTRKIWEKIIVELRKDNIWIIDYQIDEHGWKFKER